MVEQLQNFYLNLSEPNRSCALILRQIFLDFDEKITEHYKYKLPFFYFKKKPFCYLWFDKKTTYPYIGFVRSDCFEHPSLEQGNRKKMKVLHINPNKDIPMRELKEILELARTQYL